MATAEGKSEFSDFIKKQPSPTDWFYVECLVELLAPFKVATEVLSGENYPTLSLAFPILRLVKKKLSRTEIFGWNDREVQIG